MCSQAPSPQEAHGRVHKDVAGVVGRLQSMAAEGGGSDQYLHCYYTPLFFCSMRANIYVTHVIGDLYMPVPSSHYVVDRNVVLWPQMQWENLGT
jgi:hypothetical protein